MSIRGIDIASHQGPNFPFAVAKGEGYEFAIVKASGGHTYRNPYLANQIGGARSAGMATGFYHYMFEPSSGGGDVQREIRNFIEACRPLVQKGDTFWLDVEEYPASVGFRGDLGAWIVEFCEAVSREFDCSCGVYCATWYLVPTGLNRDPRIAKYPFWMASWQDALPPKGAMAPWDKVTVWQYGAHDAVAGRKPIDEDLFFGTVEEFRALGAGRSEVVEEKVDVGFQHAEGWLSPVVDHFDWSQDGTPSAGIIVERKVTVYNDEKKAWYEREWYAEGGFTPWVRVVG